MAPDDDRRNRDSGRPAGHDEADPEGAGLARECGVGCWEPRNGYSLMYQSTTFQVGPACVGLPKKLPILGATRSTWAR